MQTSKQTTDTQFDHLLALLSRFSTRVAAVIAVWVFFIYFFGHLLWFSVKKLISKLEQCISHVINNESNYGWIT